MLRIAIRMAVTVALSKEVLYEAIFLLYFVCLLMIRAFFRKRLTRFPLQSYSFLLMLNHHTSIQAQISVFQVW